MKDKFNYYQIKKGYTLLFSIIVASVVLSIAAFILSVSRKQFILSTVSRDSTMAIYAADSAMQCIVGAYYLDSIATSTGVASVFCKNRPSIVDYMTIPDGQNVDPSYNLLNETKDGTKYEIEQTVTDLGFDFDNNTCALAKITQGYDKTTLDHKVIIEARGYNDQFSAPCAPGRNNPRTVERAIRLIYLD